MLKDNEFIEIVKNSLTMNEARVRLGMNERTFRLRALKLDCYKPNQVVKVE